MSSNRLAHCPATPRSPALVRLFLGHNRFVPVPGPELLSGAPNCRELLLNNNVIEEAPQELAALVKLKVLDVSCNSLQSMPTGLGYLPELQRIVYAGNPVVSQNSEEKNQPIHPFANECSDD